MCMEGLKFLQNDPRVGNFFFPDELLKGIARKQAYILNISNSKQGFLRRLLQSRFTYKGYDVNQPDNLDFKPKGSWNPFKKKKAQPDMEGL